MGAGHHRRLLWLSNVEPAGSHRSQPDGALGRALSYRQRRRSVDSPPPSSRRLAAFGGTAVGPPAGRPLADLLSAPNSGKDPVGGPWRSTDSSTGDKVSTERQSRNPALAHGALAVSDARAICDASQLAMKLNGKAACWVRIQAVLLDGKSEVTARLRVPQRGAAPGQTDKGRGGVWWLYGSASRKMIVPFLKKPMPAVLSRALRRAGGVGNVIYTGSAPGNQLAIPPSSGAPRPRPRCFFVGTDGLRPHAIAAIIGQRQGCPAARWSGKQFRAGRRARLRSRGEEDRKEQGASVILNMLVGGLGGGFSRRSPDRRISPLHAARSRLRLAKTSWRGWAGATAGNRRAPLPDANRQQGRHLRGALPEKYGAHRPVSEVMECRLLPVVHLGPPPSRRWARRRRRLTRCDAEKR